MKLNTATWGDPAAAKSAVLIHGVTSSAASWVRVGPALVSQGYYVVAPELRGHGASAKADGHYSLGEMVAAWLAKAPGVTFHDPLAAATLFDDRICHFEPGLVEVELASERLQGLTHWTPGGTDAPHQVALAVDCDLFFEHYFSVIAPPIDA